LPRTRCRIWQSRSSNADGRPSTTTPPCWGGWGAFGADDPDFPLARRAQELEADCYAAQRLASDPADIEAAIRFFRLIGDFRFDDLHPSGSERASRIAACASTQPRPVTWTGIVTISAPATSVSVYGCEARIWIDQVPVGMVSNLRAAARTVALRGLEPGVHTYALVVRLYHLDGGFQLTPVGTVEAKGTVPVPPDGTLLVEGTPGDAPSLREGP